MTLDGDTQRQVVPRVPWGRLRAWIDEQESREEEGDVSTVSDLQMKAISQLIPIIEEPQLSGEDYVSALMRYLQARQLGSAKFIDLDPVNVLLQGAAQPRWRCVCKLDCCEGEFPRRDYGLQHSQESPMFVSKKSAKQYAASHALSFLQDRSGTTVPSPDTRDDSVRDAGAGFEEPANKRPRRADEASPTIYDQVSNLASALGFGTVSYNIQPDGQKADLFSGQPHFESPGPMPRDIGVVTDVLGKKQTKMEIAEQVLKWLELERQRRRSIIDLIIKQ